jgi:hypothetical protein
MRLDTGRLLGGSNSFSGPSGILRTSGRPLIVVWVADWGTKIADVITAFSLILAYLIYGVVGLFYNQSRWFQDFLRGSCAFSANMRTLFFVSRSTQPIYENSSSNFWIKGHSPFKLNEMLQYTSSYWAFEMLAPCLQQQY